MSKRPGNGSSLLIYGPRGLDPTGVQYPIVQGVPLHEGVGQASSGFFQKDENVRLVSAADGTSNTLLVAEMSWFVETATWGTRYRPWLRGSNTASIMCGSRNVANAINSALTTNVIVPWNDLPFGSMHPNGANFALGDGSVRFINQSIDMSTYRSLASRNQGETIGDY